MDRLKSFLGFLALSRLSILGAALTTSAVIGDLVLVLGELFVFESNPYIGIVVYLLFPSLALLGLLMIPVGIYTRLASLGGRGSEETRTRIGQVNRMHVIQIIFGLSMLNLVIFAIFGYRGFHFTESTEFCGQLCHQVMRPELATYSRSPHSEISCVECHIGAGADWFVKSKLSGARQVLAVAFDTYSRPIPTPIHNLRPAREVCEVCHRPEIFHGNRIKVIQNFAPDEANSRTYTVLNLRVGSGGEHGSRAHGIHWHVSREQEVRYYATDDARENIVWVELAGADGTRRVWRRSGVDIRKDQIDPESIRLMDCVDCHNRPTHIFLPPDRALDEWLAESRLDPSVPWIRKISEEVLTRDYASTEEAMAGIASLPSLYRERYPEHAAKYGEKVDAAVPVLQEIHRLFVFPEMKIRWNTYPSRLGHPTAHTSGCFRCHDGVLRDEKGIPITMECEACHYVLANKEIDPAILKMLEDH